MKDIKEKIVAYAKTYCSDHEYVQDKFRYTAPSNDELIDIIHINFFGFCGCGCPEEPIILVRDAMRYIKKCKLLEWNKDSTYTYEDWNTEGDQLFHTQAIRYFMFYWLDKEEFTEHGGSVPGWLTDKGEDLLEILELLEFTEQNNGT